MVFHYRKVNLILMSCNGSRSDFKSVLEKNVQEFPISRENIGEDRDMSASSRLKSAELDLMITPGLKTLNRQKFHNRTRSRTD